MLSLTLFSMSISIEAFSFYIASFSIVSINYSENHSFVYSQFQPTEETKYGQLRKRNTVNWGNEIQPTEETKVGQLRK